MLERVAYAMRLAHARVAIFVLLAIGVVDPFGQLANAVQL